jgi:hypothetical protein
MNRKSDISINLTHHHSIFAALAVNIARGNRSGKGRRWCHGMGSAGCGTGMCEVTRAVRMGRGLMHRGSQRTKGVLNAGTFSRARSIARLLGLGDEAIRREVVRTPLYEEGHFRPPCRLLKGLFLGSPNRAYRTLRAQPLVLFTATADFTVTADFI